MLFLRTTLFTLILSLPMQATQSPSPEALAPDWLLALARKGYEMLSQLPACVRMIGFSAGASGACAGMALIHAQHRRPIWTSIHGASCAILMWYTQSLYDEYKDARKDRNLKGVK